MSPTSSSVSSSTSSGFTRNHEGRGHEQSCDSLSARPVIGSNSSAIRSILRQGPRRGSKKIVRIEGSIEDGSIVCDGSIHCWSGQSPSITDGTALSGDYNGIVNQFNHYKGQVDNEEMESAKEIGSDVLDHLLECRIVPKNLPVWTILDVEEKDRPFVIHFKAEVLKLLKELLAWSSQELRVQENSPYFKTKGAAERLCLLPGELLLKKDTAS